MNEAAKSAKLNKGSQHINKVIIDFQIFLLPSLYCTTRLHLNRVFKL